MSQPVLQVKDLVIDTQAHSAVRAGKVMDLTHREFSLLATLAQHPGIVLSKVQLLTQVWGSEHYDLNLVEVHISALRRKLEEHGPRLIHTVRGVGYVLRPDAARHVAIERAALLPDRPLRGGRKAHRKRQQHATGKLHIAFHKFLPCPRRTGHNPRDFLRPNRGPVAGNNSFGA